MPERQSIAKVADVVFVVVFVLYTAGSIIWLLSGLPPVLASRIPSVHDAFHRWGANDQAYVVASRQGLEQKATEASRRVPARELALRAGTQAVIYFENDEPGVRHNLAIHAGTGPQRVVPPSETTIGKTRTQYRFTVPAPGTYTLWDETHPSQPVKLVAVDTARGLPAWVRRLPGTTAMATGAALDAHLVKPTGEIVLQYLFSGLNIGLGVLLIRVRPRDLAARLLALGMIGTAAVFNFQAHSGLEEMPGLALRLHDSYHIVAGLAYVYALLVFPDGRLVPRWSRQRWFKWPLRSLYLVVITAAVIFNRSRMHGDPTGFVLFFGVLIPIAGVTSQAFRLRQASSAAQREQSRLLIWALTLAVGVALVLFGLRLAINGAGLDAGTVRELNDLAFLVFPVVFAAIPVTLTVILVRYRLWDVDRVVNQTLVYGTLTGVLGVAYVATIVALQGLLRPFTFGSNLVVAASTLAVAALFRPARNRIQAFIDRRFYRSRYDAARTLETFSTKIRDKIDLDSVAAELLAAAEETMQPARMALSLRPQGGGQDHEVVPVAGSARPAAGFGTTPPALSSTVEGVGPTAFSRSIRRHAEVVSVEIDREDPIFTHLQSATGPVNLDEVQVVSPVVDALRAVDMRLAVPLVSQAEPIGILVLGPRRSERGYSVDDRKLLDDLAKRAAPVLRVAQLVRQLVRQQAVELRARERIEQELRVAELIQRQFLPRELPKLPGWHIAAHYQPARAVGGDFYDFLELPDGQVGLACGDVADKGVPAALVMATTHSILRGDAPRLLSPGKVLERANDLLFAEIPPQMFVTCLYGVLDPSTGRLRYANAGHNLPYVQTPDGVVELRATGMPLGLMPAMSYEEHEATLGPGDTLLLHSDGLVEAHDPRRTMFGFPRLMALVGECHGGRELIDRLLGELAGFTGPGWEQEDDITLVAIQRAALSPLRKSPASAGAGVP